MDNIDLEEAPSIPKTILNRVTLKVGLPLLALETYLELNNLFKRTMNELLFNHMLLTMPELKIENIKKKEKRKKTEYKPKNRVIKLSKDNKIFKLVLKSMKSKIEEI